MNFTTLLTILQQTEYDFDETREWYHRHQQADFNLTPQNWTLKLRLIAFISNFFFFLPPLIRLRIALFKIAIPEYFAKLFIITIAKLKLRLLQLRGLTVVAVAGSYGKTSTKWIAHHVLSGQISTHATPESYNTMLGISLDIWKNLKPSHRLYVVEYGEYHPGDIKKMLWLTKPQFGILTPIGRQHLTKFKTFDNLVSQFQDFVDYFLHSPSNLLVAKANRQHLKQLPAAVNDYAAQDAGFSLTSPAEISLGGTEASAKLADQSVDLFIPLLGQHQLVNLLPSLWLVSQLNLELSQAVTRAKSTPYVSRRHEPHMLQGDITLLDNSFNSNLDSAKASLELFKQLPAKRKLVVTMGFVEMGDQAEAAHREFGQLIAQVADGLGIIDTPNAAALKRGFVSGGGQESTVTISPDQTSAIESLQDLCIPGTIILLENGFQELYK